MSTIDPPSPCIGVCRLDSARRYCLGCYRTIEEISGWVRYSAEQKQQVLDRLGERISAAAKARNHRCPRCGTEFVCGRAANAPSCWCEAAGRMPLTLPASATCLCPACLGKTAHTKAQD